MLVKEEVPIVKRTTPELLGSPSFQHIAPHFLEFVEFGNSGNNR